MPNKYKIELIVVDNYEELEEDPYDVTDLRSDIINVLEMNQLNIEGEITVNKIGE